MYEIPSKKVLNDAGKPMVVDARHFARKERVGQFVTRAPNEYARSPGLHNSSKMQSQSDRRFIWVLRPGMIEESCGWHPEHAQTKGPRIVDYCCKEQDLTHLRRRFTRETRVQGRGRFGNHAGSCRIW